MGDERNRQVEQEASGAVNSLKAVQKEEESLSEAGEFVLKEGQKALKNYNVALSKAKDALRTSEQALKEAEASQVLAIKAKEAAAKEKDEAVTAKEFAEAARQRAEVALIAAENARKIAQEAQAKAEEANQRKSQALANMAHELRTPLNAIMGYSEMLQSGMAGMLTEKQNKYIRNILTGGQHLLKMINDILDIAKIEAGKIRLDRAWVELEPIVDETSNMLKELAADKKVSLSVHIQPDIDGLQTDSSRLRQILFNLLSNAIKYNREAGKVNLRVFKSEDRRWVVFDIEDSGIGIPEAKIEDLFTEFYQVDEPVARQQEGTGLGLCLVKRLVELQGGNISVKSQEGVGSTFTVALPAT